MGWVNLVHMEKKEIPQSENLEHRKPKGQGITRKKGVLKKVFTRKQKPKGVGDLNKWFNLITAGQNGGVLHIGRRGENVRGVGGERNTFCKGSHER